jgi:hypothetical protein
MPFWFFFSETEEKIMRTVKDRLLTAGQRVQVYYNLHQGGYSIKDKKTGLVVAYADNVLLKNNCKFKVSESGRQKVIQEKRKRVHAFIEGDFIQGDEYYDVSHLDRIYYNPYITPLFTDMNDGSNVMVSSIVYCIDKVCYAD